MIIQFRSTTFAKLDYHYPIPLRFRDNSTFASSIISFALSECH